MSPIPPGSERVPGAWLEQSLGLTQDAPQGRPLTPLPPALDTETARRDENVRIANQPGLWQSLANTSSLFADVAASVVYNINKGPGDADWISKNPSEVSRLIEGIPTEYHDDIFDSDSLMEAQLTRAQIESKLQAYDRVAQEGTLGLLAGLGIGVGEMVPSILLTGGTSLPAVLAGGRSAAGVMNAARVYNASRRAATAQQLASGFSRAGLLARGGFVGTASALSYTAIDSFVDPTIEAHDFAMAGIFGSSLGGLTNLFFGRGLIKSNMMRMSQKYGERLANAGKEGAVRFGADDIVDQVALRFGLTQDDAKAFILGTKIFDDVTDLNWNDIAVAGPKARVTGDRALVQRINGRIDDARYAIDQYSDGKIVIRAMNEAQNPKAFVRSVAEVIRRRLYNEDNGLLTNEQVVALDDMVNARVGRTVGVTMGVEEGIPPVGTPAWEVRTGSNLRTIYGVSARPWSPAISSLRTGLTQARSELRKVVDRLKEVYDEAVEMGTEAETFYNYVKADRPRAPIEIRQLRARARELAKKIEESEESLKKLSGAELRRMILDNISESTRVLEEAKKRTKAFRNARRRELYAAKTGVAKTDKKYADELKKLADEETSAADALKRAEEALGNVDREYMIRRRKEAWSDAESDRFADIFLRWLKNAADPDVPPALQPVFAKIKSALERMYSTGLDSLIMAGRVSDEVDVFFRDIFDRNLQQRLAARVDGIEESFNRLTALSNGATLASKTSVAPVANSASNTWDDAPYVNVNLLGFNLAKIPFLNQAARAMNRGIGPVRWLGNRMMWSRVHPEDANGTPVAQRRTIWESINRLRRTMDSRLIREHKAGYAMYMTGAPDLASVNPLKRTANNWSHSKKEQFSKEVYEEIVAPGTHTNPGVLRAAAAYREHFTRVARMAEDVELPGFGGLSPDGRYFPRLWKWELIDQLSSGPTDVEPLAKLIRESLTIPVVADVADPEFIAGRAITADGRDALAKYLAERLRQLARGENKNAYIDMDEVLLEVLRDQGMNTKVKNLGSGPYMTPRGRQRVPMDVAKKVDLGNGRMASLMDFLTLDVVEATAGYNRSVFGAIGEKMLVDEFRDQLVARGLKTADEAAEIKNWNGVRAYLKSEAGRRVPSKEIDAQIGHLDEIMAGIRSEPNPNTWGTLASEYLGRVLKLGYLRNGQAFGLSSLVEFSRVVGRTSASSMLKQMPIIRELTKAAREGKIDRNTQPLLWFLDHALGVGTDRLRRTELAIIDSRIENMSPAAKGQMQAGIQRWMRNSVDPNLNQAVVFYSDATGLAPITSATQHVMASSIIQEMFDRALTGKAIYSDALLSQWGITRLEFDSMLDQLRRYGKTDAKGRVIDVGGSNWDQRTYGRFLDFLERGTVSSIQDPPTRGDFSRLFWTPYGRLLTQFRTFNLKGISNFLMTSAQRRDHRVFREYMAAMVMGTLTQVSRKAIFAPLFSNQEEEEKYWEENYSPKALIGYAMTGPTENYLLTTSIDSVLSLFVGETAFGRSRYSGLGGGFLSVTSTPGGKFLYDLYKATGSVSQSIIREDREFSQKDLNAMTMLLPGRKMLGISQILDGIVSGASSVFDLPEKPR